MKIKTWNERKFLVPKSSFVLGDHYVGTINGLMTINEREKEHLINVSQKIWDNVYRVCPDFKGLVRFDLVPKYPLSDAPTVSRNGDHVSFSLGELRIVGIYEINTASPECAMATEAMHDANYVLRALQPSPCKRLAEAVRRHLNTREIVLVLGNGFVKQCWGETYIQGLEREGLIIEKMTPEEFMDNDVRDRVVYLCGDYREKGPAEFDKFFMHYIKDYPRHLVFNTIPNGRGYISDKSLLFPRGSKAWDCLVGENRRLTPQNFDFARENKDRLVLKPFLGSSGENVFIGRMMTNEEWGKVLRFALRKTGYGLFEARWLPKIHLPFGDFATDINPAFWARGNELDYLYTIARIDTWQTYRHKGIINVTQGAGYVGCLIEED
ncbi:MAG: hypothetical protein GF370_00680 [Candidatus Nealsonbacteria bacterium]|nr:hypothetical protein [Candidatus Nealsonbacteria bacterium]